MRIDAHCNYQTVAQVQVIQLHLEQTSKQHLAIRYCTELVQRNNNPYDACSIYNILSKGGTATRDILDFVTDADGDTTYKHTIRWRWNFNNTAQVSNGFDSSPNLVSKAEDVTYTVSDNSTRSGGPGTGIGVLRFVTLTTPAGDTQYDWLGDLVQAL